MSTTPSSPAKTSIWRSGIILSGALQRLGHYGIRSLLILYLIDSLHLPAQQAGQVYGLFYGSFFLTAILGGILGSARGYGSAGALGLLLMLAGHVGLFWGDSTVMIVALAVYTLGFGLFDTNLSVAVARVYTEERLRDSAYTVLYTAINIGAAIGPLLFGYLALRVGARYSFLLGGIWPLLAFWLFRTATRRHASSAVESGGKPATASSSPRAADSGSASSAHSPWLFIAVLGLAGIVFAAVFDQLGSSVTLLARRYVQRDLGFAVLPAGFVQSINPFFVILLGPLFATLMKGPASERRWSQAELLAIGVVFLGAGFGVLSLSTIGINGNGQDVMVSWIWVLLAIFLATIGELLFAPIAVSLVSGLAPPRRQALVVGVWTAVYGAGAYLSGTMAGLMESLGRFSLLLGVSAAACWAVALLLWVTSARYEKAPAALRTEG
ncbi:POT-type proton-dependent oligopeptide transporter [Burkholderia alba]|uniref:POT-type proton-dependent oligopeptide transporter n=1 Tax=Burkholderia alba TaxID=2683677 RepID=UPI002B059C3F|nr:MFS transporter [Burkholderia alba]